MIFDKFQTNYTNDAKIDPITDLSIRLTCLRAGTCEHETACDRLQTRTRACAERASVTGACLQTPTCSGRHISTPRAYDLEYFVNINAL